MIGTISGQLNLVYAYKNQSKFTMFSNFPNLGRTQISNKI